MKLKRYEPDWHWSFEYPDIDLFCQWMEKPRSRRFMDWMLEQFNHAQCELYRMEEHYLRETERLCERVRELEARFIEDSHNSSKPPSSDGLKKPAARIARTRSLREKSETPSGAQSGHEPHFLKLEESPDRVVTTPVHKCARCGRKLSLSELIQHEVRQVIDLHQGKRWVVEFRAEMKLCPGCGSMNHGGFPPEAKAYACYGPEVKRVALYFMVYQFIPPLRVCEIFKDLYDLRIGEGTIHRFAIQASQSLKDWENEAKSALIHSEVAHFDETGMRCEGRTQWLHVAGSGSETLYFVHEKRGTEAVSAMGVLSDFHGVAVHDGWIVYWKYQQPGISHALCNAHHLRELNFVYELEQAPWALRMKELLQEALHGLHMRQQKRGKKPYIRFTASIEARYDQILKAGYRTYRQRMPKHPQAPRAGPKEKKDAGHNLLHRLHFYKKETLAFLSNPAVPFTNTLAERDIRMAKLKQKISGCFRSRGGAKAFCRVRSFLSTCRKQGMNAYLALAELYAPIDYSALPEPT